MRSYIPELTTPITPSRFEPGCAQLADCDAVVDFIRRNNMQYPWTLAPVLYNQREIQRWGNDRIQDSLSVLKHFIRMARSCLVPQDFVTFAANVLEPTEGAFQGMNFQHYDC